MSDELDLSVPPHQKSHQPVRTRWLGVLCGLILIAVCVDIVLTVFPGISQKKSASAEEADATFDPEKQKDLALRLEKNELASEAVRAWKNYLNNASISDTKRARIWYRIGKLRQQAEGFESAVAAFFRAETLADLPKLSDEINRRVSVCLEKLGAFTAMSEERRARVDYQPDAGEQTDTGEKAVVAEIGAEKITKSELKHRIEDQVEKQITQYGTAVSEKKRHEQEQKMLEQFSSPESRRKFLQNVVAKEILYREARKQGLAQKPAIKRILRKQEQDLLAGKLLQKHVRDQISITESDLRNWYEANKQEFVQPAAAKISHIQLSSTEEAAEVRKKRNAGNAFSELAAEFSESETAGNGGRIREWIAFDSDREISRIGKTANLRKKLRKTEPGSVLAENIRTDSGVHVIKVREKRQQQAKSFEEVKQQVRRQFYRQKSRELRNAYMQKLKEKYNVLIHDAVGEKKE